MIGLAYQENLRVVSIRRSVVVGCGVQKRDIEDG